LILRMRTAIRVGLLTLLSLCAPTLWAAEPLPLLEPFTILNISSTGRSMHLDRGSLAGLRPGMKARLLLQTGEVDRPVLRTVAYGEVIRVDPGSSLWLLHELEFAEAIRKGQKLVYILQDRALKGVRPLEIEQQRVLFTEGKTMLDYIKDKNEGMPAELIHGDKEKYQSVEGTEKKEFSEDYDGKLTSFDYWLKQKGLRFVTDYMSDLKVKFIDANNQEVDAKKVLAQRERDVFDSYVQSIVKKINSQTHGLHSLYERDLNIRSSELVRSSVVYENTYDKYINDKREIVTIHPRAQAKVDRDGPLWSADLDDRSLREFMLESGIAEEDRRKRQSLDEIQGHEILFRFASSLSRFGSEADPNFQGSGYSIAIGYEYQLARFFRWARSVTLDAELQRSIGFYEMAPEINGRFSEGSFGLGMNYYFYNEPFSLNIPAFYIGLAFKRGNADGGSDLLEQQSTYRYQSVTAPAIHLGAKYRFRAGDGYSDDVKLGFGVNFLLAIENKRFTTVDAPLESVESSFVVQDNKFSVGMSLFF